MKFKDQLLRCGACGENFVYTVREQRRRAEKGLPLDPPAFCLECRGADVRLAEVDTSVADAGVDGSAVSAPTSTADEGRAARKPRRQRGGREATTKRKRGARGRPAGAEGEGGRRTGPPPRKVHDRSGAAGDSKARGRRGKRQVRRSNQTGLRLRYVGTVKWYDDDRGYGFIAQEDGEEVFVHCTAILVEGSGNLEQGLPVEYELEQTARGMQAVDVIPLA